MPWYVSLGLLSFLEVRSRRRRDSIIPDDSATAATAAPLADMPEENKNDESKSTTAASTSRSNQPGQGVSFEPQCPEELNHSSAGRMVTPVLHRAPPAVVALAVFFFFQSLIHGSQKHLRILMLL